MNTTRLLSAALMAAALSACGGGGSDSTTESNPASSAGNPSGGTTTTTPVGTSAAGADKYVGTWVSGCADSVAVAASAPTVALKQTVAYTFAKVSDAKASLVQVTNIYASTGCTGAALATHTNAVSSNALVIDGTATVDGSSVDKVTVTIGAIGGLSAGGTINLNGIVYPGNYFMVTSTTKNLTKLAGNALNFGNTAALDAQGYPTALNSNLTYTKQ